MHRIRSFALRLVVASPALLVGAACSSTPESAPGGAPPAAPATHAAASAAPTFLAGSALVVHSAGLDALLADPRDAGLRHALALVDARLAELPDELDDYHVPPGALELAFDLFSAPFTLRLDLQGGAAAGPLAPDLQWTVRTESVEQTKALTERFAALLAQHGLPSQPVADRPELASVATPVGNLFFGTIDGGATFHVSLGEPRTATPEAASFGLPAGDEPLLAFGLDMARLQEPLKLAFAFAGPESLHLQEQCEAMGLFGADAIALAFVAGRAADRAHVAGLYRNWLPILEGMGLEAPPPISESMLHLVPLDATLAQVAAFDAHTVLSVIEELGPDGAEARARLEAMLGLDLAADIVEPLGGVNGFYLSDTTGGGGLASGVLFFAVADEARFAHTLTKLAETLDDHARERLHGRVRTRTFDHGGTRCLTVDCVGIPAPLQISLALEHGYLFVTATPQALVAALDHARSGTAGLSARPDVAALGLGGRQDVQSVFFCDAPRLLNAGYGYSAALAAMLANALRSPTDPAREPGFVLPPYRELLAGARPTLMLSRVQGDDLVFEGECDPSAAAHATSLLGWVPSFVSGIPLLGMLSTMVVPQVVRNLEAAQGAEARADLAMLDDALTNYAIENMGRYPDSLEALVTPDEEGNTFLDAEEIPLDPWGNPYVYELDRGKPRVTSFGADGVPGGEGEDADIDSGALPRPGESGWVTPAPPAGPPPLLTAVRRSDADAVRALLEDGADPDAALADGLTALHVATGGGRADIARLLLEAGASPAAAQAAGATPLHIAASTGNVEIAGLLLAHDAYVDARDQHRRTPLMAASTNGHRPMANLLLDRGADVEARDEDGATALIGACRFGHEDVATDLLDRGADLETGDELGYTALHVAAHDGERGIAEFLLAHGANPSAKSVEGATPRDLAQARQHSELVELLERAEPR